MQLQLRTFREDLYYRVAVFDLIYRYANARKTSVISSTGSPRPSNLKRDEPNRSK